MNENNLSKKYKNKALQLDSDEDIEMNSVLPLVSIVTPSFNQGNFIRQTIESVLSQDYPNLEYWVIDGKSTDNTISILEEYEKDPRFKWISEEDDGQSDAINKGWSLSNGDIWSWLNSDDTLLPNAISTQVQALLDHPECGACYGDGLFIDAKGNTLYKCTGAPYSVIELLRITIPLQPTVFLRRSLCNEVGFINTKFKFSMDSEYWLRASKITQFIYVPSTIATYRLHKNSKTVGNYSGFYQEWLTLADSYLCDPSTSEEIKSRKDEIYSGIFARIACIEAEEGSIRQAAEYLLRSLKHGGVRPRLFKSVLIIIERFLPFNFVNKSVELWTYTRTNFITKFSFLIST